MSLFRFLIISIGILACSCVSVGLSKREEARPNLVVIMADDLGYGDLGCYGSETQATPNIDGLATDGLRCTDFYVTSPVCTPSRVAFLTGRHPVRVGFGDLLWPTSEGGLPEDEITLPEILSDAGYATGLVGKWHLGHSAEKYLPLNHGFEMFYGIPYPNDMDPHHPQTIYRNEVWPPMPMMRGNEVVEAPIDVNLLTQQYTAAAVQFIAESHNKPFFLFLSHSMPHSIIGASPDFRGGSGNGLYGDSVQELDWSVGEVLRSLRAFGLEENTLVLFTSDNGAVIREQLVGKESVEAHLFPDLTYGNNGPLRAGKQATYEGGVKVPAIFRWPGVVKPSRETDVPLSIADILPTFLEMADLSLPEDRKYDGIDISDTLKGLDQRIKNRPFYFGSESITAVRIGGWKLVLPRQPKFIKVDSEQPMLYNLAKDPGESLDLAEKYPEKVSEMLELLREFPSTQ